MKFKRFVLIITVSLLNMLALPVTLPGQNSDGSRHYRLVKIDTFGGPESYINPHDTFGSPNQINASGTMVGGAGLAIAPTPTSNGFICFGPEGAVPFVNHAFEWQDGRVSDLGTLAGPDNCSVATSINPNGEIAGTSENGLLDPTIGVTQIRAVIWRNGKIEDLGTFGGSHSAAAGINNRGQVVGYALNAIPDPISIFGFLISGVSTGTQTRAFLWQSGNMQDLGTLGGPDAFASLLNERGQVAGNSYVNSTPNTGTGIPTMHGFLWENGNMTDLGSLGGTLSNPIALNNRGQVVGFSTLAGDQTIDQFLWDGKKLIDLTTDGIGGSFLDASAINDAGQIIGGATFPTHVFDAALWTNGILTDLGALDGDCYSVATVINSRGQVAGVSFSCDFSNQRGFLWENGAMFDLNALIPADSGLKVVLPLTMSDRGEIAGNGLLPGSSCGDPNVCGRAFVLIPTDSTNPVRAAVASQTTRGAAGQTTASMAQSGPAAREVMERIRARLARRDLMHGFGAYPKR